jgi:hypothetical protein
VDVETPALPRRAFIVEAAISSRAGDRVTPPGHPALGPVFDAGASGTFRSRKNAAGRAEAVSGVVGAGGDDATCAWRGDQPSQSSLPLLADGTPDYTSFDANPVYKVLTWIRRAVGKLYVVPVGALPVPVSGWLSRPYRQIFSGPIFSEAGFTAGPGRQHNYSPSALSPEYAGVLQLASDGSVPQPNPTPSNGDHTRALPGSRLKGNAAREENRCWSPPSGSCW